MPAIDVSGEGQMEFPAYNAEVVTPDNATELTYVSRSLYVGVGGDVSVQMQGTGTAVVFKNVPTGSILPIRVKRVNSTATTATNMVSIY